jgi:peptidoglycan/xylan/chitin deacetylase (PgdA/CDA1 family)
VTSRLTIVMYHYVRDLSRTRYPRIKGLDLARFRGQLEFFARHYNVIGAAELIAAVRERNPLPPRALLLTFDDGYSDHFKHVFPLLADRQWGGCFFPVSSTVTEHRMLDVNKIHFILAAVEDPAPLVQTVMDEVERNRSALHLEESRQYWDRCSTDSRYDSRQVTFLKRMLQRELPEAFRAGLVDQLFRDFVTADEAAFAAELYMDVEQLRCMTRYGMAIGSHGDGHYWMNTLSQAQRELEIERSLAFLALIGAPSRDWLMCYPYGGHDEELVALVARRGAGAGFATTVGIADLGIDNPLSLPRLDTNDLPVEGSASAGTWTQRAYGP